mmetsp:Transcript_19565/g.24701  ORF Transcript_19565/g.24701 Transcript_19565/m.24701 type:complete len:125 (-) Transcript_19565:2074-2448(-)
MFSLVTLEMTRKSPRTEEKIICANIISLIAIVTAAVMQKTVTYVKQNPNTFALVVRESNIAVRNAREDTGELTKKIARLLLHEWFDDLDLLKQVKLDENVKWRCSTVNFIRSHEAIPSSKFSSS